MSVWSDIIRELRDAVQAAVPTAAAALLFETPPDAAMGDIAVPCFALSKILKQSPGKIAGRMAEVLSGHPLVAKAEAVGAYCNVTLENAEVARRVLTQRAPPLSPPQDEGGEEVVLEFVSPNSNKPLHLGHLRNAFFGETVARLLEAAGHRVHRVMLLNDRGIAMAKAMLAYEQWGQGTTPESEGVKGDHFVGGWYVRFEQESTNILRSGNRSSKENISFDALNERKNKFTDDAQELVRKWEAGDKGTRALWEQMCEWVIAGHRETLDAIGITFEKTYRESDIAELGRAIVADALTHGVLTKDEKGNTIAPLKDRFGLEDKVVERADGTTVYATQDIALVEQKAKDYPDTRSIVVTAVEQDYYFQQINAILGMLGVAGVASESSRRYGTRSHTRRGLSSATPAGGDKAPPLRQPIEHLSYEMVHLPEGRMKSREGTVVDADDLLAKLEEMATAEIAARADAVPGEPAVGTDEPPIIVSDGAPQRARDIALAAIRFYFLHANPRTVLTFNPKESLAFTGKTGPYLQYAHARMCAMQRRAGSAALPAARCMPDLLTHDAEKALLLRIARFPDVIAEAASQRDPSHVAQFSYDFAQTFADFYRDCPVLTADTDGLRNTRLALVAACRNTLSQALTILGIVPLEEM